MLRTGMVYTYAHPKFRGTNNEASSIKKTKTMSKQIKFYANQIS